MIETFEGYNAHSRTLAWHVATGFCMGATEWVHCEFWTDPALPVRSGDVVHFGVCYPGEKVPGGQREFTLPCITRFADKPAAHLSEALQFAISGCAA